MIAFMSISLLGECFLILATLICCIHLIKDIPYVSTWIFMCLAAAFAVFLFCHLTDHFELLNVFLHSHTKKPLIYKIAGTWGSHEGSLLLWCVLLSLYQFLFSLLRMPLLIRKVSTTLFVTLQLSFLIFLYLASNPFERLLHIPLEGQDLNPVLQDISLAIHPPHLYLGTLGFALPFILSLSLLITHTMTPESFKRLHNMTLIAQTFLTIGIVLGSFWAYYELGWGGWWFFDPVENLALIPWLLGLMGIHITLITGKTGRYQRTSIILSLSTFLSCLFSLTLIRSGMLNSVHSFGMDEKRGSFLFILFLFWAGLSVYTYRTNRKKFPSESAKGMDRGSLMAGTSLFIFTSALAVLLGTLFPFITNLLGWSFTLDHSYYIQTFVPLWIPCLVLLPLAITLKWVRSDRTGHMIKQILLQIFVLVTGTILFLYGVLTLPFEVALWCGFSVPTLVFSVRKFTSITSIGQHMAHMGFALSIIGIAASSILSVEDNVLLHVGESTMISSIPVLLQDVKTVEGPNYKATQGIFSVGTQMANVMAEERHYWTQITNDAMPRRHLETGLTSVNIFSHILVMLSDISSSSSRSTTPAYAVKIIYKPYINIMWLGFILIIFGLFVSSVRTYFNKIQ
ncbi:MAG: cytochrome c biogenesis protein CcsA [Alphaproteobacteria bacterium]|nr:cytochrome c biogenesis protein CcsA [Alphaproteobacteria bacterium]